MEEDTLKKVLDSVQPQSQKSIFNNENLIIRGNVIFFFEHTFQITHISRLWFGDVPRSPFPLTSTAIFSLLGLSFVNFLNDYSFLLVMGYVLIGIAIYQVYKHFKQIQTYGLNIELSSGSRYSFTSSDINHLKNAQKFLSDVMENYKSGSELNYNINLADGIIMNNATNSKIDMNTIRDDK